MAKKQAAVLKTVKSTQAKRVVGTLQNIRKIEKKKTEQKAGKIGTLGDIVFTVSEKTIQTFDGLKIESKTNYAKHTRHNKKPLLEFQYNDTDAASFTIYLSAFLGVNPRKMQDKIDKYRKKGKILTLVIGGKKYGTKWVITQHSKDYEKFDNKGNLLIAKSSISLQEYPER
ncbi:phage tail protein [Petralouisia muris]|uniref:Phage tail protein n=1 Tax=Petralouisia muris TaxID=3032872 RepID=A0AC61RS68_9FIRM|nr:phage tail protein [Petralouisia muris]TGY93442.1 phage tail protein [Petralouisia muris]